MTTRATELGQAGFTMVELIVTMIIIGIMAIAVVPRMDLLRGFDEIGFRDQVKATLEYARKSAVAGRRWTCVGINASGDSLVLTRDLAEPETRTLATVNCPNNPANQLTLPGTGSNTIQAPVGVILATPPDAQDPIPFATPPTPVTIFDPLGRAWGATNDCNPVSTTQYCYSVQGTGSATAQIIRVERETGYVR